MRKFAHSVLFMTALVIGSQVVGAKIADSSSVNLAPSSDQDDKGQSFASLEKDKLSSLTILSSADKRFRYEGRFDVSESSGPTVIWQGSRISIDFEGSILGFQLDGLESESFFNVSIDGATSILAVSKGENQNLVYLKPLSVGRHTLRIFKRSEAAVGAVRFKGLLLENGAKSWTLAPVPYKVAMEFYGDSITVGACNEDGTDDQWVTHLTHNNALSYAAQTAAAFSADYRNIAVSGMGVCTGYVEVRAGEMWNKLYPKATSAPARLSDWIPDLVFVNLGENDDSFSRSKGEPFPPGYAAAYVSLVKAIRGAYPKAHIVLLRGGMYGGSQSATLIGAWKAAVDQLESSDPSITHFVFTHWSGNHPRVADDKAMAEELIAWLKAQPFMKDRL